MRVLLKEQSHFRFKQNPAGSFHDQFCIFLVRGIKIKFVQFKKHKCSHRSDTFVPVQKRMVFNKMKKICCSHFRNGRMEIFAGKR